VVIVMVRLVMGVAVLLVVRFVPVLAAVPAAMTAAAMPPAAVAERHSAKRHNQTNGQDRYKNAACNSHDVPPVWDGLVETFPMYDPTKMRLFPCCVERAAAATTCSKHRLRLRGWAKGELRGGAKWVTGLRDVRPLPVMPFIDVQESNAVSV
jgi:hypothetical protein